MPAVVSSANDCWLDSSAKPPTYFPGLQLLLFCSFLDKRCRELSRKGFPSALSFCSTLAIWVDTWLLLSETGDKTYITIPLLGIVVLVFNASTWEKMQEGWEFRSSLSHVVKLLNKKKYKFIGKRTCPKVVFTSMSSLFFFTNVHLKIILGVGQMSQR